MRPDVGTRSTLLVRLPMPPAVRERIRSDRATWAVLTARTLKAETYPLQVQRDRLVLDGNADGPYSDGVECDTNIVGGLSGGREDRAPQAVTPAPAAEAVTAIPAWGAKRWIDRIPADDIRRESERQAFLRRVQYVDPRERRA